MSGRVDYSKPLSVLRDTAYVTRHEIRTGSYIIPIGTIVEITAKFNGFAIQAAACKCCGVSLIARGVTPAALEAVE